MRSSKKKETPIKRKSTCMNKEEEEENPPKRQKVIKTDKRADSGEEIINMKQPRKSRQGKSPHKKRSRTAPQRRNTPKEEPKEEIKESKDSKESKKDSKDTKDTKGRLRVKEIILLNKKVLQQDDRRPISFDDMRDGKRIFINHLHIYGKDMHKIHPQMINFKQLLDPQLGMGARALNSAILPDEQLHAAVFSSFVYDEVMVEKVIKLGIPVDIILHGPKNPKMLPHEEYANVRFMYPRLHWGFNWGTFHPKIMLLQFTSFLRCVISSSNLGPVDWIMLSQVVWFQDFPLNPNTTNPPAQDFHSGMSNFLEICYPKNLPPVVNISDYDFAGCSIELVISVPGRHTGEDMKRYGVGRIKDVVERGRARYLEEVGGELPEGGEGGGVPTIDKFFGKKEEEKEIVAERHTEKDAKSEAKSFPIQRILCQTSSLGKLSGSYLEQFYSSFTGSPLPPTRPPKAPKWKHLSRVEIQFPTENYILNSDLGPEGASCILLSEGNYNLPSFPRDNLHLQTVRPKFSGPNTLFHSKCVISYEEGKGVSDQSVIYMGSHNLSRAAWGWYEKEGTQLAISNYEIGVFFNVGVGTREVKQKVVDAMAFQFPTSRYGQKEKPWLFDQYYRLHGE